MEKKKDLYRLLPPTNEVWGKVIFSEACVKNSVQGGCAIPACIAGGIPACLAAGGCTIPACLAAGGSAPGGCLVWGVPGLRGCLVRGGAWSGGVCLRGCLVEKPPRSRPPGTEHPPRDGYCCGRYASYWNAFLYSI